MPGTIDIIPAASSSGEVFLPFQPSAADHVRILTSDIPHQTLRRKSYKMRDFDFGVQVSFNGFVSRSYYCSADEARNDETTSPAEKGNMELQLRH